MTITPTPIETEALLDALRDGVWRTDARGVIQYVNPAVCRILCRDADELVGRPARDFTTSVGRHMLAEITARRHEGIDEAIEFPLVRGDGRVIWSRVSAQPLFRDGRYDGVLAVVTDITAERALREQQEAFAATLLQQRRQLETILDMVPAAIVVTERDGSVALANTYNRELTGRLPSDLAGLLAVVHPDDREALERSIEHAMTTSDRWSARFRVIRADGSPCWVRSHGRVTRDGDAVDQVFVATFEDDPVASTT